jgi:hypothetical protein
MKRKKRYQNHNSITPVLGKILLLIIEDATGRSVFGFDLTVDRFEIQHSCIVLVLVLVLPVVL